MSRIRMIILVFICAMVSACQTNWLGQSSGSGSMSAMSGQGEESNLGKNTTPGVAIGGSIAQSMDSFDRVKLTRALDKSPGRSTSWVNEGTGVDYTVTPLRKVTVNGNPFCRQYQAVANRNGQKQQMTGTACVAADGAWSEVRG